jgi:hypothetical protein
MILFCKCLYGTEAIIIKIRTLRKQKKNNLISPKRKSLLEGLTGIVVHDHWKPSSITERITWVMQSTSLARIKGVD